MQIAKSWVVAAVGLAVMAAGTVAHGEDWPTYRHDSGRTGLSGEKIDAPRLTQLWVRQAPEPPHAAWYGPAKVDAFHGFGWLRSTREYDRSYGVSIAAQRVFVASSTENAVFCLTAADDGSVRWSFVTGGPVRIAPTVAGGPSTGSGQSKVYFGSDDGYAYCLNAADGTLVWKLRPSADGGLVLHNGQLVSLWPVRTGVAVADGTAYFGAGWLPWRQTYLCAVDASTGKAEGAGRFIREFPGAPQEKPKAKKKKKKKPTGQSGLSPEGAICVGGEKLIVPQGRTRMLFFSRTDGAPAGKAMVSGGVFAMRTANGNWSVAPGPRKHALWELDDAGKAVMAYPQGLAAVHDADSIYVMTQKTVVAQHLELKPRPDKKGLMREAKWSRPMPAAYSIVATASCVLVGRQDALVALAPQDGTVLFQADVLGKVYDIAVSDGRIVAATDTGNVYCFGPSAASAWQAPKGPPAPPALKKAKAAAAFGPSVKFLSQDRAKVHWGTETAVPTTLIYTNRDGRQTVQDDTPKTEHFAVMEGLYTNREFPYHLRHAAGEFGAYTLDTTFNFSVPQVPRTDSLANASAAAAAAKILEDSGIRDGLCLVVGGGDPSLIYELARASRLRIVAVDADEKVIAAARNKLLPTGLYGTRMTAVAVASLAGLPTVGDFANLVVAPAGASREELLRVVQAGRGVVMVGSGASYQRLTRPIAGGARGVWSHQYATTANAGFGGETLDGVRAADQMVEQWVGRPGPRYQTDRNGRKPSPLWAGGRLYVQGWNRIVALDARSGVALWSLDIPPMIRMNMPIDACNWCADEAYLYVAVRNACWQIDGRTGRVVQRHTVVPGKVDGRSYDWGYVARAGDLLLGSPVVGGSAFTNFWGRRGWYDHWQIDKVCTDTLFARDVKTAKDVWTLRDGKILHTAIASDGRDLYYLTGRNKKVARMPAGRIKDVALWADQFLVCVDLKTARKKWETRARCAARDSRG